MTWQPIETAPAETWVLCYRRGWRYPEALIYTEVFIGPRESRMEWRDDSGDTSQDYDPTHWMPLPDPPEIA